MHKLLRITDALVMNVSVADVLQNGESEERNGEMTYTKKQQALFDALNKGREAYDKVWFDNIVPAVNALVKAIENKEEYYDACFPPEIERAIDHMGNCTAWIYTRLESAADVKASKRTSTKIRKAMGYMG